MRQTVWILMVVLLVVAVLPAHAGFGFGGLISIGKEKQEFSSAMIFRDSATGDILVPESGCLCPGAESGIHGQIVLSKDWDSCGQDQFKFWWSTVDNPTEQSWMPAKPTSDGLEFTIPSTEIRPDKPTPLKMRIWIKNGKKTPIQIFVLPKVTLTKGGWAQDQLWIVPRKVVTAPTAAPAYDAAAAIALLAKNQQKIVDGINADRQVTAGLVARMDRIENWADMTSKPRAASAPQPAATTETRQVVRFDWRLQLPPGRWAITINQRNYPGFHSGVVNFTGASPGPVCITLKSQTGQVYRRATRIDGSCTVVYSQIEEVR